MVNSCTLMQDLHEIYSFIIFKFFKTVTVIVQNFILT